MLDADSIDLDERQGFCAAWLVRALAVALLLAGTRGVSVYADVDATKCPQGPVIHGFWTAIQRLGGFWLLLDVAACCFVLRIMWLVPRLGRFGRTFSCSTWCLAVFGLAQYSMQLPAKKCWGPPSLVVMAMLMVFTVVHILWWIVSDCDHLCNTCGEAGYDYCLGGCFELSKWPEAIEAELQERGELELWVPRKTAVSVASNAAALRVGESREDQLTADSVPGKASPHPKPQGLSPSVLGRRTGDRRAGGSAQGHITVLRDGQVLHTGRTRRGVNRWIKRHLPDQRGVTVEDASSPACRRPQKLVSPSRRPDRPLSPSPPSSPSSQANSDPPSASLTPREVGRYPTEFEVVEDAGV